MERNKRIGLIIPNLQSGGAERVISITSNLLSNHGYEVYIFLFDTSNISYEYSGTIISLRSEVGTNFVSKVVKRIIRIAKLSYFLKIYCIDITISFLYSANVVNYFSLGRAKKILACRGYDDFRQNGLAYSRMIKNIHSFIVQTDRMKKEFIHKYHVSSDKIKVLPNPFDIFDIEQKSCESIEENIEVFIETHKTICTTGSFKRAKGYWHLLRAFSLVKANVPNAGLIFIGHRGEQEEQIKEMAKKSIYSKDILFLGYKENPYRYISKCDLYVCSSLSEGFPNAIVEAMACSTIVLSTDCLTGPREILSIDTDIDGINNIELSKYGILVPNLSSEVDFSYSVIEDEESIMAKAITLALCNEEIRRKYMYLSKQRAKCFSNSVFFEGLLSLLN